MKKDVAMTGLENELAIDHSPELKLIQTVTNGKEVSNE
jgi:hypothetical protein